MLGIEETKDVISFGAGLGNALGVSLEDGKISIGEYTNFIAPLMKLPAALSGISDVQAELLDLDEVEREELVQFVKSEFDIPNDQAEQFIEETVDLALSVFDYVKRNFLA